MTTMSRVFLAVVSLACLTPMASYGLTPYSQDFELLDQTDPNALADDGWLVFGNVFDPGWTYLYGYGPFPAPNEGSAFCAIVVGEGGPEQGQQQISVLSDYNNTDHGLGYWIESNVFQEQTITADDVGQTWIFAFDAKLGNLTGQTTALAFIKTLDPGAGYQTTNFITEDMTQTPVTWTSYSLSLEIDDTLVDQILQIGFSNTATNYEGSGVFYDNIDFDMDGPTPVKSASWGEVKSLFR